MPEVNRVFWAHEIKADLSGCVGKVSPGIPKSRTTPTPAGLIFGQQQQVRFPPAWFCLVF